MTGGVLALGAAILIGSQIGLTNQVQSISSQDQALSFISNPMTPCVLRVQVTQQVIQQLPAEVSVPATLEATNLDRRIPAAEVAAAEARRVAALYPEGASDPALVETLVNDIELAKEQG